MRVSCVAGSAGFQKYSKIIQASQLGRGNGSQECVFFIFGKKHPKNTQKKHPKKTPNKNKKTPKIKTPKKTPK